MKFGVARVLAYAAVVAAVTLALRFAPPLPDRRPAAEIEQGAVPSLAQRFDTLASGERLAAVLRRNGLSDSAAAKAVNAAQSLEHGHVPAGMPITVSGLPDSLPSDITLQLTVDRVLRLHRTGATWSGTEDSLPWKTDTIVVAGSIQSNLYAAMDQSAKDFLPAGARQSLTESLADVFEYRIDMTRDLQKGDEFKVIAERSTAPNGTVKMGKVLAGMFSLSRSIYEAVRFTSTTVQGDYFDQDGKSLRAAFLRAPLEFRRISSGFGLRVHPILGDVRMHEGMDYAAAEGTPVRAIGDGVVIKAGWGNGYGNMIEIRHKNGYVTRYGHMRNFASGMRVGEPVRQGETIGFVGSTGLSTGPHLHFEVLVNGVQRDPSSALSRTGGEPVPAVERAAFLVVRDRFLGMIEAAGMGASTVVAQR